MRRLAFVVVYLVLLVASWIVRSRHDTAAPLGDGQETIAITEYRSGEPTGRTIRLAYWDLPASPGDGGVGLPVVVLHGSPVATPAMWPFMRELRGHARVIAPDLPGFGATTREVADYGFDAHARAVLELLDRLGVARAHVAAYSMGGGVALELARIAPERVASIELLSSLGVQELELLGDYSLNHAVHGLQYAGIHALEELTPHFGLLDRFPLNTSYARNFLDGDQRPIRGILERYAGPMLIVHGDDDGFVPVAAAREHARLVPQSRLKIVPGGHLIVIYQPEVFAGPVLEFVRGVERGIALTRGTADPERVSTAAVPFDWRVHGDRGPEYAVLAAVLLALATLASEDLACISGGLLVSRGALSFLVATAGCLGGIVVGDLLLFLAGRWLGARALRHRPWRWFVSAERVEQCAALFERRGAMLVLLARFLPGLRLPTYFAAGATGMRLPAFLLYFLGAAILWTPLLVGVSILIGDPVLRVAVVAGEWGWLVFLLGLVCLWIGLRVGALAITWRGRRQLLGWWRRHMRWEFWPAWVVYPPVAVYCAWLAVKHRGATLFTAVNPAMPCGGLAGESKSAILGAFPPDTPEIARFRVIAPLEGDDTGTRLAALDDFIAREGLKYPVVLKPDVGERGQGVAIVRERVAAADFLHRCRGPVIAQEFVAGREFGVFYVRKPSEPRGRIISITAKHLISVRGDGTSTLEELILRDDRAVCMAPFFMKKLAHRLGEVPGEGENVRLTELGTHCRGALFLDGWPEVWSETLEARVDVLSRKFVGYYFGRYDVRTASPEMMREHGEFKVLELNGVTSECTHMYDPKHSLLDGWRILCRQWRLAFEIGAENRARGVKPATVREIREALAGHSTREIVEV